MSAFKLKFFSGYKNGKEFYQTSASLVQHQKFKKNTYELKCYIRALCGVGDQSPPPCRNLILLTERITFCLQHQRRLKQMHTLYSLTFPRPGFKLSTRPGLFSPRLLGTLYFLPVQGYIPPPSPGEYSKYNPGIVGSLNSPPGKGYSVKRRVFTKWTSKCGFSLRRS